MNIMTAPVQSLKYAFRLAALAASLVALPVVASAATKDEEARQDHAVAVALSKLDALQPLTLSLSLWERERCCADCALFRRSHRQYDSFSSDGGFWRFSA